MFEAGGTGMMSAYIRGVASDTGVESANVGIYVDGVPYVNTFGNDIPIENIQRIEILKGPQSVLYGKNSYAGVVNIISKKPSVKEFEGDVGLSLGSDDKRKVSMTLNAPVVKDKFSINAFARHYEKDGFIWNTTLNTHDNYKENNFGKLQLLLTPSQNLEFSLISTILDKDDGAPTWNMGSAPDRTQVASGLQGINQLTSVTHAFKADYAFGNHKLSAVTTFKDLDNTTQYDADFTPAEFYHVDADMDVREISQEIRLTGQAGPGLWTIWWGCMQTACPKTGCSSSTRWCSRDTAPRAVP